MVLQFPHLFGSRKVGPRSSLRNRPKCTIACCTLSYDSEVALLNWVRLGYFTKDRKRKRGPPEGPLDSTANDVGQNVHQFLSHPLGQKKLTIAFEVQCDTSWQERLNMTQAHPGAAF